MQYELWQRGCSSCTHDPNWILTTFHVIRDLSVLIVLLRKCLLLRISKLYVHHVTPYILRYIYARDVQHVTVDWILLYNLIRVVYHVVYILGEILHFLIYLLVNIIVST